MMILFSHNPIRSNKRAPTRTVHMVHIDAKEPFPVPAPDPDDAELLVLVVLF